MICEVHGKKDTVCSSGSWIHRAETRNNDSGKRRSRADSFGRLQSAAGKGVDGFF